MTDCLSGLTDSLIGVRKLTNGTDSNYRPYRAFDKYVELKKVTVMSKLTMLRVGNTYNKHYNKQLFNLVFVGETILHERYHESTSY